MSKSTVSHNLADLSETESGRALPGIRIAGTPDISSSTTWTNLVSLKLEDMVLNDIADLDDIAVKIDEEYINICKNMEGYLIKGSGREDKRRVRGDSHPREMTEGNQDKSEETVDSTEKRVAETGKSKWNAVWDFVAYANPANIEMRPFYNFFGGAVVSGLICYGVQQYMSSMGCPACPEYQQKKCYLI